jgi:nitrite reductase/ring-hydroxylating ferredoxin subunit
MDQHENEYRWVAVGTATDWADGSGRLVELGKRRIGVYRLGEAWYACKDYCPHAGVSLVSGSTAAGSLETATVRCPAHGWEFDLRTGQHLGDSLLGKCRVTTYPVRIRDRQVEVGL